VKQAKSSGPPWRDKRRCAGSAGSDPGDLAALASLLYLRVLRIDRFASLLPQLGWFCHRAAALRVSMASGKAHLAGASRSILETAHATILDSRISIGNPARPQKSAEGGLSRTTLAPPALEVTSRRLSVGSSHDMHRGSSMCFSSPQLRQLGKSYRRW
jgi:hypothetical protein